METRTTRTRRDGTIASQPAQAHAGHAHKLSPLACRRGRVAARGRVLRRIAAVRAAPLALLVAAAGCVSAPLPSTTSADRAQRCAMRRQQILSQPDRYVVGMAEGPSLVEARNAAFAQITDKLAALPESRQRLLRGLYRIDYLSTGTDGRVHVLAVVDREAASAILRKRARHRRWDLAKTLDRCGQLLEERQRRRAQQCLAWARQLEQEITDLRVASRAVVDQQPPDVAMPESRRLPQLAERVQAQEEQEVTEGRPPSVLVHIERYDDGERRGTANEAFVGLLRSEGLRVKERPVSRGLMEDALGERPEVVADVARAAGASYALIGRVERRRTTTEHEEERYALASGTLRLIDASTGQVLAEVARGKIRGGDTADLRSPAQAFAGTMQELKRRLSRQLEAEL